MGSATWVLQQGPAVRAGRRTNASDRLRAVGQDADRGRPAKFGFDRGDGPFNVVAGEQQRTADLLVGQPVAADVHDSLKLHTSLDLHLPLVGLIETRPRDHRQHALRRAALGQQGRVSAVVGQAVAQAAAMMIAPPGRTIRAPALMPLTA